MNVPPVSYSASSAVTSPEISGSGRAAPATWTLILINEPTLRSRLGQYYPIRIAEPQHERVRQLLAVVDVRR